MTAWQSDKVLTMRPGDTVAFAGRNVSLDDVAEVQGPNYIANQARFRITGQGKPYQLTSEKRSYPSAQSQTTEAGIRVGLLGNFYISMGEPSGEGVIVRMWNHPLIIWIWLGGFTMALGGAVSLSDRRLRVGAAAPAPAAKPVTA